MIKAQRKGTTAQFADKVWATGQPQRYGWIEIGGKTEALKTLPLELVKFAEIRKGKETTAEKIIEAVETGVMIKKRVERMIEKPRLKR